MVVWTIFWFIWTIFAFKLFLLKFFCSFKLFFDACANLQNYKTADVQMNKYCDSLNYTGYDIMSVVQLNNSSDVTNSSNGSGSNKYPPTWTLLQGSDRKMYGAECTGGSCVSLTNTQQGDAGAYTCTADNGVGAPHAANIFLTVQCK